MQYFNTFLQFRENTGPNFLSGVAQTAMTTATPSDLEIYCQWVTASQLKATFVCLLEILALIIATLSPQRYMYQKDLNWMQWHRVLRVKLCLLGTILQELIAQRDYESTLVFEGRKNMLPTVSQALSEILFCSQWALKRPVSVSIKSVTLSGDILGKMYKGYDRIWFISPFFFS